MIALDHVECTAVRVGDELSGSVRERGRILLELFTQFWYRKDSTRVSEVVHKIMLRVTVKILT